MIRTIVGIEEETKTWLDLKAAEEKISRAELIRREVHFYRKAGETQARPPVANRVRRISEMRTSRARCTFGRGLQEIFLQEVDTRRDGSEETSDRRAGEPFEAW